MALFNVQEPWPPFDYGSAVQWTGEDGSQLAGSIYAFSELDGERMVSVEIADGGSVDLPLSSLQLSTEQG